MYSEYKDTVVSKQFGLRSPKGLFGIEIETEGESLPQGAITPYFVGKLDGSLRDGMEYISNALPRDQVREKVDELRKRVLGFGARLRPTYRSSTHIHLNYCDRRFRDVLGMQVLWALVEPVVFRLMPPGRDGSLFCVSSYDAGELPDFIDRFCTDIGRNFSHGFNPRGKYSSLNITRLGPGEHAGLGTLEYRVFPTTMEGRQIQEWCEWLFQMDQFVTAQDDESFLTMVSYAEQNPVEFLERIFGQLPVSREDAADLVDFGARTAYEMARVIDRHLKIKKNPSKKSEPKLEVQINWGPDPVPQEVGPVQAAPNFPPVAPQRARAPRQRGAPLGVGLAIGPARRQRMNEEIAEVRARMVDLDDNF